MDMTRSITLPARAKINLYLDILSRRDNGYHNILSIMQSVGLCDTVTLTRLQKGSGICLETDLAHLPTDRRNLAYRAAEKFADILGHIPDISIRIEKRIPMAAGLGGGSADAAAVLRGLDRLFGTNASRETLCALGASLGADIPFCIAGGAMVTRGIGEILTPCTGLRETQWLVVACGGEGISTPEAYRALDDRYDGFACPREEGQHFAALQEALLSGSAEDIAPHMYNIFEEVVLPTHSTAGKLIDTMKQSGALAAMMSGSGPSVFGLFAGEEDAREAAARIGSIFDIPAFVTHPTPENK